MAPSSGQHLIPIALRVLRQVSKKTSSVIRSKLSSFQAAKAELQPIWIRNETRQPIHPAAYRRQSNRRWFTTGSAIDASLRRFASTSRAEAGYSPASLPKSTVGVAVGRITSRVPFASTLRPNLTGGALPRTAGGYAVGAGRVGGVRQFSHMPAAPAEVISNVSAAVRAFWLAGQRAQFDGVDGRSGQKRFKVVTLLQDEAGRKMQSALRTTPGSYVDFHVNPTITAISPLGSLVNGSSGVTTAQTLDGEGLLDRLAIDFARAVKHLGAVLLDLQRLSALGDFPLSMPERSVIRVRFPGCDSATVERLCDEVGVRRGIVGQDEDFDVYARADLSLLFPFAPSRAESVSFDVGVTEMQGQKRRMKPNEIEWQQMMSSIDRPKTFSTVEGSSEGTNDGIEDHTVYAPSGYGSLYATSSQDGDGEDMPMQLLLSSSSSSAEDFEGLQGIYRFLELCDGGRR